MPIYRCNVCGYIYREKDAPCECPFCRNKDVFEEIPLDKVDFEFLNDAWTRQVNWMNVTKYDKEIQLNPDKGILQDLADGMIKYLKDGKQCYCPCRVLIGNEVADRKIICPCYLYMGEIELQDRCHCSLYVTSKSIETN
jgi:ferredoxin-thioredoxin reductase catalytic subunit